jgi:hypothetical protein
MRIKIRRMTNAARLLLSGANAPHEGELVYATDTKLTYIGDGTTTGGNVVNVVYGTYPGEGKPSAAPTAANPATVLTNANGEVFRWNGTAWYLSGNGYAVINTPVTVGATSGPVVHHSFTAPRAGGLFITASVIVATPLGGTGTDLAGGYIIKNGANILASSNALSTGSILSANHQGSLSCYAELAAGSAPQAMGRSTRGAQFVYFK